MSDYFLLSTNGSLCLNNHHVLDRESKAYVDIIVRASDDCMDVVEPVVLTPSPVGSPALYEHDDTSLLWVRVNVLDVNDFRPMFFHSNLVVGLAKRSSVGDVVYRLKVCQVCSDVFYVDFRSC